MKEKYPTSETRAQIIIQYEAQDGLSQLITESPHSPVYENSSTFLRVKCNQARALYVYNKLQWQMA